MGLFDGIKIDKDKIGIDKDRIGDSLSSVAKQAQDGIAKINLDKMATGVLDAGKKAVSTATEATAAGVNKLGKALEEATNKPEDKQPDDDKRDVIALLWFLAHVDGHVSEEEKASISQIAPLFDETYDTYAVELEQSCAKRLAESSKEFGAANAAKIEASRVMDAMDAVSLDGRLLCWNMLALSDSDGIDEDELDFIRYVSERAGVEHAVFEELLNYRKAIDEIEASKEQLESTQRSYGEIEPLVSEFSARQMAIVEAAQALVTDR